jgi:hypothetical protein
MIYGNISWNFAIACANPNIQAIYSESMVPALSRPWLSCAAVTASGEVGARTQRVTPWVILAR